MRRALALGRRPTRRPAYLDHTPPAQRNRTPRVLLEIADGADRWAYARAFRAAGYEVLTCGGPTERERCPLVDLGRCGLVETASVVVMNADVADVRDLLAAHATHGSPPLVLEAPESRLGELADIAPPDTTTVLAPGTARLVCAAADAAYARSKQEGLSA